MKWTRVWLDFSMCKVFQCICLLRLKLFKKTLGFFSPGVLKLCNNDEKHEALKLLLVICTVHLVICLDRWARKCSNVISNTISSTKFISTSKVYSDLFQTSLVQSVCINSEGLNAINYFWKKTQSYIFKKVLNTLS